MDFGGAKAELEDGLIFMMAGGSEAHSRVATDLILAVGPRLRGSGCRPYDPDMALRTDAQTIRHPDVSIYCDDPGRSGRDDARLLGVPTIIFEVLSPSTHRLDLHTKLPEYKALAAVQAVVLVDLRDETIRLVQRTATGWIERVTGAGEPLVLDTLGIAIPHADIFSRD